MLGSTTKPSYRRRFRETGPDGPGPASSHADTLFVYPAATNATQFQLCVRTDTDTPLPPMVGNGAKTGVR